MPAPTVFALTEDQCQEYHRLCRSSETSVRLKERLAIVWLADEGLANSEIAKHVRMSVHTVGRWYNRYSEGGHEAIENNLHRGAAMNGARNASYSNRLTPAL